MLRSRFAAVPAALCLLAACSGSKGEAKNPSPDGSASAAPTAAPDAAPSASASAASTSAPKSAAPSKGPYDGEDPGKTVALTGPKAWTLDGGDGNSLGAFEFVRANGTKNVFKDFGGEEEFSIPGAFTYQPKGATFKKGDPVFATIVSGGECARVLSVKGDSVTVAFMWSDKLDQRDFTASELLPFDGQLGFGAPVAYKEAEDQEDWGASHLVYKDDKNAYLVGGIKVPAKLVRPLDVKRVYKAGDKVLAIPRNVWSLLGAAKVTKVLNDGLEYEVKFDNDPSKTAIASYCSVTAPIKK